ncbi:hypothetical protein A4H97_03695 [Niastella yeongjuensis]|uniref:T9SS C-terminal target domain-containing protein n=1 Tax=Niastella yeongjuensis TaxID=354355 RepID=A0A1V9EXT9_9BACT|nr:hypothetical protein [Niastella yeongjuensis]OQP50937.1 hypothetical protein A4H97_03695 [Niastella yeongjuensis]SEN10576.1 hypothetical protein SAMN05660816_00200 [Niastella yeongjuensis]
MKKLATICLLAIVALGACKKSDDNDDPNGGGGNTNGGTEIRGVIKSDLHWTKDKTYRLRGYVYVQSGVTLTIDPGTKIVSNKDSAGVLVIYRGAKIMAQGTASEPIVFTSNEGAPAPGDLGGVILVGQATGNNNHSVIEGGVDAAYSAFGGSNDADNSGVMKYVRIEYAGKAVNPGDEVNGLSLYGVGSGTTLEYIQVIRGLDDAFEFFGGTVNAKHLIAYNCADDDFDMDDGFRGKIQFAVSVKDPKFTDAKGTTGDVSNNFEVDNVNPTNGFQLTRSPITFPVLSNFTAIGPNGASGTSADYGWNMRWRRGCKFILGNSIVLGGQKGGLRVEDDSTIYYYLRNTSNFYNSLLNATQKNIDAQLSVSPDKIVNIKDFSYPGNEVTLMNNAFTTNSKSTQLSAATDANLTDPFNNATPNLKPATGSPALTGALFDFGGLSDGFFEKVSYRGAFDGTNDWTAGWAIWNK